ncbi:hypothetical protein NUW58_g9330 [Xylaria curta]|uniref:Uncharacterized protein n=1 Tax=Xylaria curta TaxID=42375 RepID=A0ACC1MYN8_9PEZI|nr:hypothetical protein NUW58_g9330 [Xylaria curta]
MRTSPYAVKPEDCATQLHACDALVNVAVISKLREPPRHLEIVRLLLERGANIKSRNRFGWTPLLQAASSGHLEIVQLLIEKDANIESGNRFGQTPLLQAASSGYLEIVQLLIEKGANIESEDSLGRTPLLQAASSGHLEIIVSLYQIASTALARIARQLFEFGFTPINPIPLAFVAGWRLPLYRHRQPSYEPSGLELATMNTATVSMAVTPTVLSTFLSHYLNRKPLRERPTAHLSYDEGLHLIKSFLAFASQHTVEDLQAFTSQWVPHPQWVKVKEVEIPEETLLESAHALQEQLGPDGIRKVGGRNWWQWRRPETPLRAEWIEMRSDYNERMKSDGPGKRVMLYIHGGGYFFGSVDEHRYQMQRHARKLKARVFAPNYRLAPQFPFPCGLQDCLAAYLYLLKTQDPSTIILAGDSAGGGMVLSTLITLRDQGLPLPAGAILISPWVDLSHSFPSCSGDCPLDYIPPNGFHHKPSQSWPPLNADEHAVLKDQILKKTQSGQAEPTKPVSVETRHQSQDPDLPAVVKISDVDSSIESRVEATYLSIHIDGKEVLLKDQIQMYTTNALLSHPLVSPIMQPSLGGLPPLLIMTGGGEILRDEQIYLAHKCADPGKYPPGDIHMNETAREQISRFKPTDVQLQVWDDLCHVAPTLSFTRPAKYMYRSIAQFGAWALARAQKTGIEILDDDRISFISSSGSDSEGAIAPGKNEVELSEAGQPQVGKAGDPLPPFKNHMIRQRVSRHGVIRPLEPCNELPACNLDPNDVGVIKEGPSTRSDSRK